MKKIGKEAKHGSKRDTPIAEKRQVVNMNFPPKNMPMKEVERFWGEPTEQDGKWAEALRNRVVKKKSEPTLL